MPFASLDARHVTSAWLPRAELATWLAHSSTPDMCMEEWRAGYQHGPTRGPPHTSLFRASKMAGALELDPSHIKSPHLDPAIEVSHMALSSLASSVEVWCFPGERRRDKTRGPSRSKQAFLLRHIPPLPRLHPKRPCYPRLDSLTRNGTSRRLGPCPRPTVHWASRACSQAGHGGLQSRLDLSILSFPRRLQVSLSPSLLSHTQPLHAPSSKASQQRLRQLAPRITILHQGR